YTAERAKLPLIPPYLQPGIDHQLTYGVNFASAGAGALLETRQGLVIDLQTQLGYFKNVSRQLRKQLGDAGAESLLSRAVYLFSVGGNGYTLPFEINSTVPHSYSPEQFVGLVIGNITTVVKEIYENGGRKFGFVNLLPISCFPSAEALLGGGRCFEQITPYVKLHKKELPKLLQKLQSELKGFKYSLLPFYSFLDQRINHPSKYGFKEGKAACCGSGLYRGIRSCGGKKGVKEYYLCKNVSEYVFFDSSHPTERANQQFVNQSWNGKPTLSGSHNLKALFESY
ncbi:GDSL esterase/lipase 3-like, partial [Ziziphus jujuba]|uniref:GDSL esterase/lipase 3-like n=1 Tax=Ziziphus jujuba TaxID=326968 RepID=A0ABM3ZZ95_ZIZJJ